MFKAKVGILPYFCLFFVVFMIITTRSLTGGDAPERWSPLFASFMNFIFYGSVIFALLIVAQITRIRFVIDEEAVEYRVPGSALFGADRRIPWARMNSISTQMIVHHLTRPSYDAIIIKGARTEIQLAQENFFPDPALREILREVVKRAKDHPHVEVEDELGWLEE